MYDEVALARWIEEAVRQAGITVVLGAVLREVKRDGRRLRELGLATRYGDLRLAATGFVDATGGGGWGPVATPTLISSGRMIPRKVIGTVDTSEFLVAMAASLGFIIGIGGEAINFTTVAGLLIGGVIAAPIAAYLVRHIPGRLLGSLVGGIIVITNARTLMSSFEVDGSPRAAIYVTLFAIWGAAVAISVRGLRRDSAAERAAFDDGVATDGADEERTAVPA